MYKVLGMAATRTMRVLWMMEELGLKYEHLPYPPRSKEMLEINPSGKVPALIVEGQVILDSVAIMQFLADKHAGLTYAAGTVERGQQDSFTQFINDELDAIIWCAARNSFILPKEKRVPEIKDTLKWEFGRSMNFLGERIGDNTFLMGDKITVPDLLLTHMGDWAKVAGFDVPDGPLEAYFKRMVKRPAYLRASALRAAK
ncbi:MAG: glutathione S-transferase family protein [Rhodobacterales bacterium]